MTWWSSSANFLALFLVGIHLKVSWILLSLSLVLIMFLIATFSCVGVLWSTISLVYFTRWKTYSPFKTLRVFHICFTHFNFDAWYSSLETTHMRMFLAHALIWHLCLYYFVQTLQGGGFCSTSNEMQFPFSKISNVSLWHDLTNTNIICF